ncbi:hypothetical protein MTX78_22575 [Hymenobacter tibetensis]|uniref:STAS/SEC14 domain-containing protein n=1 Tax=Hymenobacter tibetensis TaxID=497967 RepID=A0ABY4CXV8_9BACT|nr:hypothetical protein [Hymenobacter tibetensis]UOG74887.1 hypothetical protein MTX78_22575 [Hymenobacter tibetensis]
MSTTPQLDYLDLHYRSDLGIVTARWTRPMSSSELRNGYQTLLRYAATCSDCRYWLIDSRRRVEVDARDVHWLTNVFYPTLRTHMHGVVFLAFLVAPYQLHDVQDDSLPSLPHNHGDNCSLNQFINEGEAVHWLMAQGAHPVTQRVA